MRAFPIEWRLWAKVKIKEGCWEWTGHKTKDGCGVIKHEKASHRAPRVAWELLNGRIPDGLFIDHTCNNEGCVNPSHLRLATRLQNAKNRLKKKNSTSPYKGITRKGVKWQAQIVADGKMHYLGLFKSPEEAHVAYCEASTKLHGQFGRHR